MRSFKNFKLGLPIFRKRYELYYTCVFMVVSLTASAIYVGRYLYDWFLAVILMTAALSLIINSFDEVCRLSKYRGID